MQIKRLSYRIKGFVRLADYTVRWVRMVTEKAKQRVKILAFWEKHDLETTIEAFGVSERTLYLWRARQKYGDGHLEALNDRSHRPNSIRHREWPFVIKEEIRRLRQEHSNLGKEKVYEFLKVFCLERRLTCPSISTIGNLIRDMGGLRTFPVKVRHNGTIVQKKPQRKARKPKYFIAEYPGHCGSFDTIEKIRHGCRRYVITFTDLYSRFSFAWTTTSHASLAAKEFFDLITFVFPFPLKFVLTDNGSEFMKHFDTELRRLHKVHWHTYPKCPKMNTHAERFNRTIQEEYIDFHEHEILNTNFFNIGLIKHLIWHNTERPHWSLNMLSPVKFITQNYSSDCNMYLTDTFCCFFSSFLLIFFLESMTTIKEIQLNIEVWKDSEMFVSYVPQLDVSSCGKTVDEAKKNIREAVELFLEESEKAGTINQILEESGFSFDKTWQAPDLISFERTRLAF